MASFPVMGSKVMGEWGGWLLGPVYLDSLRLGLDYPGWGGEFGWKSNAEHARIFLFFEA